MFSRLGRMVTRHPWWVIACWVVIAAVIFLVAPSLSDVSSSNQADFLPDSYESAQAQKLAQEQFPQSTNATSVFVVKRADGAALTAAEVEKVTAFADALGAAQLDKVAAAMTSEQSMSPDGTAQLVTVVFTGADGDESLGDAVPALRDKADALLDGTGLQAGLTGMVAIGHDTTNAFRSTERIVTIATVLLIIVLVGLIFRSPIAAILPIVSIGVVYALSSSLLALLAKGIGFQLDESISALLIVVLFGIGTDYILFLLFRYRERLRAGEESRSAVATSVARVGQAIASSGLVVMAAMVALFFSQLKSFQTMAPAFLVSVFVMLLASLTLIPAILTLIGPKVFWPSKQWQTPPKSRVWKGFARQIAVHPVRVALVSGGLLVVLAVGAIFMSSEYGMSGFMPADTPSSVATRQLEASFPAGALSPTQVYVTSEQPLTEAGLAKISAALTGAAGVGAVAPPMVNQAGTTAIVNVSLANPPNSTAALDSVGELKQVAAAAAGPGERVLLGGQTMAFADIREAANRDYKVIFPVAAVLILLILAVLLRSVVAPFYLLAGVWLGFAATLGATVIAFQGIGGSAGVMFMMPMVCYVFVVAVGSDYNILLTTRLREEILEGATPHDAAAMAVEHAGPTVASAGLILAATFGSMMLSGIDLLYQIGFAVMVGILLVAIVMASALIPSVATLLGRRVWWPGRLAERTPAASGAAAPAGAGAIVGAAAIVGAGEPGNKSAGPLSVEEEPLI